MLSKKKFLSHHRFIFNVNLSCYFIKKKILILTQFSIEKNPEQTKIRFFDNFLHKTDLIPKKNSYDILLKPQCRKITLHI